MPWLSLVTFLPILGGILVALLPGASARMSALAVSLVTMVASVPLWFMFDPASTAAFQLEEGGGAHPILWIAALGVHYHLGIDGVSLLLILLTTVLTPIIVLAGFSGVEKNHRAYYALMLVLEGAMIGTFVALDTFVFYLFWELVLIPMYFLIGIWGGERRLYATVKFFVYTVVGSLLMLVALIGTYALYHEATGQWSTDLIDLMSIDIPYNLQYWMFAAFALAFAIKVPLFPLHTWLPDAHVEAPTGGSVVLAGVMLKMGTYGFYRFAIPLFPDGALDWGPVIVGLSAIAIVYGALVALVQDDIKKLVAYSSVSHMGAVMLGLFGFTDPGVAGSVYQMLNHGVSTGALFLLVGVLYERRHTRKIADYGGLSSVVPVFATVFLIVTFSSIGLPGLNGFVGEFMILLGAFKYAPIPTALATTGVIFGAAYMLWAYQRMMFGPLTNHENKDLKDLNPRELAYMAPLVALIFIMGLFPQPFLDRINPSVDGFLGRIEARIAATSNQTPYHTTTSEECLPGWLQEEPPMADMTMVAPEAAGAHASGEHASGEHAAGEHAAGEHGAAESAGHGAEHDAPKHDAGHEPASQPSEKPAHE